MANLSVFSIVGFGMMVLECIFSIIALSTTHWGKVDESQTGSETNSRQVRGHWGFFEICRTYEYDNTRETSETCTSTDDEDFSDYWKYSVAFEILAFITSLLVLPVWLIWIFRAKSADIWPISTLLKATTVVMLYVTAFFHGLAAGIWSIHKVGPYDSDVLEFEIGWSWALAIFCVVWAVHGIIPVMFSQLSDKDVDGDPVWFYPPSFIAETRKRNVFYRCCATLCLGMPFSKAYSELLHQESGHRVSVPVLASSSPSSVDDDDDLKKPQSNPEANDENFENNEMRCDIDERDSVKNFEEEKLAQKSSTDQNGKAQSKDNPLEQGHGDGKVTKDKDEGKAESKTETVAIKETPKTDEASTKEEPQASVPVPTKTSSITESTPTRPPAVPQQTQDPVPTDSPDNPEPKPKLLPTIVHDSKNTQSNVQKVEAKPAPPVTKDDYKSKQEKGESANSKLKKIKKKRQEAKKDEKSQAQNNITDVDI